MLPKSRRTLQWAALGSILLLAAGLRLYHADQGLPDVVYVDAFKFVGEASRMAETHNFEPRQFQYPGLFANILGLIYLGAGFKTAYARHLAAVLVSALAGIGLCAATYLLARRICSVWPAILSTVLAASCLASVTLSRIPAPDILMCFLIVLALWMVLKPDSLASDFILAGALTGIAVAAKYTAIYLLPWLALAAWMSESYRMTWVFWRKWGGSVAAALAAFIISNPMFLSHASTYLQRLSYELQLQHYGQIGRVQGGFVDYLLSWTPTWEQPWLGTSLASNLGPLLSVAFLVALIWALFDRDSWRPRYLALFAIVYLIAISSPGRLKAYRFLLPILPVAYALIGRCFERSVRQGRFLRMAAVAILAVLLPVFPLFHSVRYAMATEQPLTNDLCRKWMAQSIREKSTVLLSPFFVSDLAQLPLEFRFLPDPGLRQYRLPEGIGPSPERNAIYYPELIDACRSDGINYIVLNSYFDAAFTPVPENLRYFPRSIEEYGSFLNRLKVEARLVYEVKGWSDGRLGPDITIYRLTAEPSVTPIVHDRDSGQ